MSADSCSSDTLLKKFAWAFCKQNRAEFFVLAELNDITAEFGSVDRDDYWLTEIKGGAEVTYES